MVLFLHREVKIETSLKWEKFWHFYQFRVGPFGFHWVCKTSWLWNFKICYAVRWPRFIFHLFCSEIIAATSFGSFKSRVSSDSKLNWLLLFSLFLLDENPPLSNMIQCLLHLTRCQSWSEAIIISWWLQGRYYCHLYFTDSKAGTWEELSTSQG